MYSLTIFCQKYFDTGIPLPKRLNNKMTTKLLIHFKQAFFLIFTTKNSETAFGVLARAAQGVLCS